MLRRKMLRDINKNKIQFFSIFLMLFMGVYVYVGMSCVWIGLRDNVNQYYKDTNLADYWVYANTISDEDMEKLRVNHLFKRDIASMERRTILSATVLSWAKTHTLSLEERPAFNLFFYESGTISKPHLMEGKAFNNKEDGLWLDSEFAQTHQIHIGDSVIFQVLGQTLEEKVVGIVTHPEFIYSISNSSDLMPDHTTYGFAVLSQKSWPMGIPQFYNQLLITSPTGDKSTLKDGLAKDIEYSAFLTREDMGSYEMVNSEVVQLKAMGQIYPGIFIGVAALITLTTMIRIINGQRQQIGTLRVLGFQNKRIFSHYLSYNIFITVLACLLAFGLAPFTWPPIIFEEEKKGFTLPSWDISFSMGTFLVVVLLIILCILVAYLACRSVFAFSPAESLRPKVPAKIRLSLWERRKIWKKFNFSMQWNMRDMRRNKLRSVMAVFGIFGCSSLLIAALGIQNTLDDVVKWQFEEIYTYTNKILLSEEIPQEKADGEGASRTVDGKYWKEIKEKYSGEAIYETAVVFRKPSNEKTEKSTELLVTEVKSTFVQAIDTRRDIIDLPQKGIAMSEKLLSLSGLKVGDSIEWRIYGDITWHTSNIMAAYRSPVSQNMRMSQKELESAGLDFKPTAVLTSSRDVGSEEGIQKIMPVQTQIDGYKELSQVFSTTAYGLIIFAILLSFVAIYNLSSLSFMERTRELATLKVIGFSNGRLKRTLISQNLILTLGGMILGVPFSVVVLKAFVDEMGDSYDIMPAIFPQSIFMGMMTSFLLSLLFNYMFLRRMNKLDMVEKLKYVE